MVAAWLAGKERQQHTATSLSFLVKFLFLMKVDAAGTAGPPSAVVGRRHGKGTF